MKKFSLYITLALLSLVFGACDTDNYTDWADPQSNPQEDAITIPGYTASAVDPLNLADVTEDSVSVYTLSTATLPEGYSLTAGRIVLTPQNVENADSTTISTTVGGKAAKADLQAYIESVYGKAPEARTFEGHVYTSAIKDGEACLIDAGKVNVVVTPVAPDIDDAYYVLGGTTTWDKKGALTQKFNHSATNVYDDPVFTIIIKAAADADTWFAVAGTKALDEVAAGKWDDVLGTKAGNGKNGYDGKEEAIDYRKNLSDEGSFCVPKSTKAKYISIEINMLKSTIKITPLSFDPTVYVAGDGNDWKQIDYLTTTTYDGKYQGYMYLKSAFKICTQQNWDGTNYGQDFSTAADAANIPVKEPGYYAVDVDLVAKTLNLTKISTIGLIGDATPGDWTTDTPMTYNVKDRCWEIKNVTLKTGTFKFRANNGWDISWGGTLNKLTTKNGSNINVEAGTYDVKLYAWADGFAKAELIKK